MFIKKSMWQTHLFSFCSANWQGIGNQQSSVLLLHYVDAGYWNYYLQVNTAEQKMSGKACFQLVFVGKCVCRGRAEVYLSVLEQNRGVETGMGVSDVQPTMVGHFLLQGTDVCWEGRRAEQKLTINIVHSLSASVFFQVLFTYHVSSLHS